MLVLLHTFLSVLIDYDCPIELLLELNVILASIDLSLFFHHQRFNQSYNAFSVLTDDSRSDGLAMDLFLLVDKDERDVEGKKDVVVDVVVGMIGLDNGLFDGLFREAVSLDLLGVVQQLLVKLYQALDVTISSVQE